MHRLPLQLRPPGRSWLADTTALLVLTAQLPIAPAHAAVPPPADCPAAAVALIDGLYRWHRAQQNSPGPMVLVSQRQRFTPELYHQLVRAAALQPGQGGGLDFDVFSGTQVNTFGARVNSCTGQGGSLLVAVAVQAGLRDRPSEVSQRLRYTLQQDTSGHWRIADITYLPRDRETPPFHLSGILQDLLQPPAQARP